MTAFPSPCGCFVCELCVLVTILFVESDDQFLHRQAEVLPGKLHRKLGAFAKFNRK